MAVAQRMSEQAYQEFVLSGAEGAWELHDGRLVEKPGGDLEIWRIHPYERTLTSWKQQSDGSYQETMHRGGSVAPIGLPGVTIDLDRLWDS
jgi:hypothetical protein